MSIGMDTFYESKAERFEKETQIVKGVIAKTATDPDDDVPVIIPDFHPRRKLGPCGWTPKWTPRGVYFPHKGDHCTVALTEEGDPEIIRFKVKKKRAPDHSGIPDEIVQEIDDLQNTVDDLTPGPDRAQPGQFAQTGGYLDG